MLCAHPPDIFFGTPRTRWRLSSELGKLIRDRREALGLSLRQLAKTIGKSPSFVLTLERERQPPAASEETLRALARALDVDPDQMITLAGKTPQDVAPETALEVSLYRRVKGLSVEEQERLLRRLNKRGK